MNDKKICFISCVNNKDYEQEEMRYLAHLSIPDGYEMDFLSIWDAASMTSGYNEGMRASDAKYKVYLHQDVFIINRHFIYDILEVFKDPRIGMIGMVGVPKMPENAIMWEGPRVGQLYSNVIYFSGKHDLEVMKEAYQEVEAVDGLLMATQYDIPWREDLFRKWDFYDASQSAEFRRAGYQVVVPRQEEPWCIHDADLNNFANYYGERKIYLREYRDKCLT
jgi:hypothetical protein